MLCVKCGTKLVWDNNPSYVGWWCEKCQEPIYEDEDEEDDEFPGLDDEEQYYGTI